MPGKRSGSRKLKSKQSNSAPDNIHDSAKNAATQLAASASSPLPPAKTGPQVHKSVSAKPDLLRDTEIRGTDICQAGEPLNTPETSTTGPSVPVAASAASKCSYSAASTDNSKPTAPAAVLQLNDPHPVTDATDRDKGSMSPQGTASDTTTPHETAPHTVATSDVTQTSSVENKDSSDSTGSRDAEEASQGKDPATEPITDSTTYFAIPAPPSAEGTEASEEPGVAGMDSGPKDAHAVAAQPPPNAQDDPSDTQDVPVDAGDGMLATQDVLQVKDELGSAGNSSAMREGNPVDSSSNEAPGAGPSDSTQSQIPSASPAAREDAPDAGSSSSSSSRSSSLAVDNAAFVDDAASASVVDSSTDMVMGTRGISHAAVPADTSSTQQLSSEGQQGINQQQSDSAHVMQAFDVPSSTEKELELEFKGGGGAVTGAASDTATTKLFGSEETAGNVLDVPATSSSGQEVGTDSRGLTAAEPNAPDTQLSTAAPVDTAGLAAAAATAGIPYNADVAKESAALIAAIAAAGSSIRSFPSQLLPDVGTSPSLTSQHMEVLSVWYSKFCSYTEAQQQAAIRHHCSPNMRFEDNFIKITGQAMVGVQFYALKRAMHDVQLLPEKVELLPSSGKTGTTYTLRVISRIVFTVGNPRRYLLLLLMFPLLLLVPDKITMWVTDELTVRTQDNKLLVYKQQVHNIPTAPAAVRWLLGLMSSWLLTYLMNW